MDEIVYIVTYSRVHDGPVLIGWRENLPAVPVRAVDLQRDEHLPAGTHRVATTYIYCRIATPEEREGRERAYAWAHNGRSEPAHVIDDDGRITPRAPRYPARA